MQKKKVALFSSQFLPYSQTFVYDEIINHKNYDIEVFSRIEKNRELFPYNKVNSMLPSNTINGKLKGLLYSTITYSKEYKNKINKDNFDLIHAHFGTGSIYSLQYKQNSGLPLITTFHGYDVPILLSRDKYKPKNWRYWLYSKSMLKITDRFLAASDDLHNLLIKIGAPPEKIKTWQLGIKIPKLAPPKNKNGKNILMVGRFVEKKGFKYGIEAFIKILKQGLDVKLNIVGTGTLYSNYYKILKKEKALDRVNFLGKLNHDEVLSIMQKMDLLLAPSVIASNGDRDSGLLVAKEASACYVPVIGTYHGGIPEIIDNNKTGFLVNEKDSETIAEKMYLLLKNDTLRKKMGIEARIKMEKEYDIKDRVDILEKHYDEVIYNSKNK